MKAGRKPLAMFFEEPGFHFFPEAEFDLLVAEGKLVKRERAEAMGRRVLYASPDEAWRITAMLTVIDCYPPGWNANLERITGSLLGYDRADVEHSSQKNC
jgi:hypothetical protein